MTSDVGSQLRKGVVEFCILGLLEAEPTYGWKLSEQLVDREMIASIGTLYPILGRLRAQGLVSLSEQDSESGRPRKYYSLSSKGMQQLQQFRDQWHPFTATVSELISSKNPSKGDTE